MCKGNHRQQFVVLFLLFLFCGNPTGCAPTFSKQLRQDASPPISFQQLLEEGGAHRGRVVIIGGYILEVSNEQDGTLLTMLQAPLDSRDRPGSQDLSEGRFLVRAEKFLDPEICSKGRRLSVAGTVSELQPKPLGDLVYNYPVIEAKELRLWPKKTHYIAPYDPYYRYWHHPWYPYPYFHYPWFPW